MVRHFGLSASGQLSVDFVPTVVRFARKLVAFTLAAIALSFLQLLMTSQAFAEMWRSEGNWVISGSPKLGGCTMATRFRGGEFMSITAVAHSGGVRLWEMLVSNSDWDEIQSEEVYRVEMQFAGSGQPPRPVEMKGFKNRSYRSAITNALVLRFVETSDLRDFIAQGLLEGRSITLGLDRTLMGTFGLEHSDVAFREMKDCLNSRASNYEA